MVGSQRILKRGPAATRKALVVGMVVTCGLLFACCGGSRATPLTSPAAATDATTAGSALDSSVSDPPGSPASTVSGPVNVYSHTAVGDMSPAVANARALVYVPSNDDGSVTVIDQKTMKVVDRYKVGKLMQHVVPGWDLTTLYATASDSNKLVPINPATGRPGKAIPVQAPYNLYFTPDGKKAVVMAERLERIDFYDRVTWKLLQSVKVPCKGVNHADWSPDGSWFVATCEFSGDIIKVDTNTGAILNVLALPTGAMPQDLRLAPDGSKFYVADMMGAGLWILDAAGTKVIGSIKTGVGAHGIYPNRDATRMYVTNRGRLAHDVTRKSSPGEGSVSVIDPATDTVVATWPIPGGGSPDMGGLSADGTRFWVSGRYDDVVYVFDTATGLLLQQIPVPSGPHGLAVFPQPGRYSLGHTGNFR